MAVNGPGLAKSKNFLFSEATLMIAPQSVGAKINPVDHGIGLVKNVMVANETTVTKLTQGITNMVVDTAVNGVTTKFTAEVYEFTPLNLTYGLSLDASVLKLGAGSTVFPLSADVAGTDGTTPAVITVAGDVTSNTNGAVPWTVGMWVFLQGGSGSDQVFVSQIASAPTVAAGVSTIDLVDAIPISMAFSHLTTQVGTTAKIDADQNAMDTSYTARVAGLLKKNKSPFVIHFPSVKITKGFQANFSSRDFSNMPFEFDVLFPTVSDPGYDPRFATNFTAFPGAQ